MNATGFGRSPHRGLDARQRRLLRLAAFASVGTALALISLKTWGLLATGSVALLSSLADSVLDLVASLITFFALRFAVEPPDREHRFGHGKSEAVAGLVQALIVTGSAAYVAFQAVARMLMPEPVTAPLLGTGVMLASLALTVALVLLQQRIVAATGSLAVAADAVHYRADLMAGGAVIAALFLSGELGWHWADPLLGLIVVGLILLSVRSLLRGAFDVLLDRELPAATRHRIREIAEADSRVRGVHDLRTRSAGAMQFIQLHLEVDAAQSLPAAHEISVDVERNLAAEFPAAEILIHVDPHEP